MYLDVGKIIGTIGLKGELKIYSTSSFSNIRFKKGNILYLDDEFKTPLKVLNSYMKEKNIYVVKFENIDNLEEASKLKNIYLLAIKDNDILDEDEYFYSDLANLDIIDEENNKLGKVIKVEEFNANITLKCIFNDKNYYIPFNDFFIKKVDLENNLLIIHYIEGLIL